jgi:hypothetical protein
MSATGGMEVTLALIRVRVKEPAVGLWAGATHAGAAGHPDLGPSRIVLR